MFSTKEKDEILNACDTVGRHVQIMRGDDNGVNLIAIAKHLQECGYVKITPFNGGILYWLTDTGFALKGKGGFSKLESDTKKKEKKVRLKGRVRDGTFFLLGVIVIKLVDYIYALITGM